jgi:hypothetical protein
VVMYAASSLSGISLLNKFSASIARRSSHLSARRPIPTLWKMAWQVDQPLVWN